MTKNTIVPWHTEGVSAPVFVNSLPGTNTDDDFNSVAVCHGPDARANAEFIVRAVNAHDDLLEALTLANRVLLQQKHYSIADQEAMDIIQTAIAKAEGK